MSHRSGRSRPPVLSWGRRTAAASVLLPLVLLAQGCAALRPAPAEAAAPAGRAAPSGSAGAEEAPTSLRWRVEVQAPGDLKQLLERYLDIARLAGLTADGDIGTAELGRLVDAAPAQARDLLETEGYFGARVTAETLREGGTGPVRVRVQVDPGPRTRVERVDLVPEGDLARALDRRDTNAGELMQTLRQAWPMKPGAPFRNADWSDAKSAVLARLRASGYATASFSGTVASVDAEQHRTRLFLVVDSGPLFRSGDIEVEGLGLHDAQGVRHLASFSTGAVVTDALLLDFQDRLLKSGLFEQATVTLDTESPDPSAARLRVKVTELSRHQLTTGVGISTNSGPRATVEHIDRRAFGWAATARNKAEWGRDRQAWDGELSTHVREDGYRWFTGVTIERLKTDDDVVLSQRVRLGRALEHVRIERSQYAEAERAVRRTSQGRSVDGALTGNHTWVWRDVDSPLLPTDGQTLSLQLGAGLARGSGLSSPLLRAHGRATVYRPLGGGWFGQARLQLGQVLMKDEVNASDNLGFRAGGDDSVRGYAYRSLGPVRDGAVASGKVLVTGSVEVAHPVAASMPTLWGALFVDAGGAADRWSALDPVAGVGFGLRWRSPVGPLRLDLAYGEALRHWRMHFSVGIVF